jgi:hypothetical protein
MKPRCTVCDSTEHLQDGYGSGGLNDVCLACFYIWYDGIGPCARPEHGHQVPHVHGEDIREFCLKARKEGTWPFDGHQLPRAA